MKTSYHCHTRWCDHAEGELEDVILAAINANLEEIAITEHIAYPEIPLFRLKTEELNDFFAELDFLINKYKNKIKILKALEVEFIPEKISYYHTLINTYDLDFLLLGQHFNQIPPTIDFFSTNTVEKLHLYEKRVLEALDTGLFPMIAHPDLFMNIDDFGIEGEIVSKNILQKCQENNIIVEINANGIRNNMNYPNDKFFSLAKNYNLTFVINSDSHTLKGFNDDAIKKAYAFANKHNIVITEYINFK